MLKDVDFTENDIKEAIKAPSPNSVIYLYLPCIGSGRANFTRQIKTGCYMKMKAIPKKISPAVIDFTRHNKFGKGDQNKIR